MMSVAAWAVIILDTAGALGMLCVFGLLGSMLASSISSSDRWTGLLVWAFGLLVAAHPIPGIIWCLRGEWWWALGAGIPGIALGVGGVWFVSHCIEAAARP